MNVCITDVPEGTRFKWNGKDYVVTDRDGYPLIEAKCLTEPNDYEGLGVVFWNFEKVEVEDGTKVFKQSFVEVGKHHFVRHEELG